MSDLKEYYVGVTIHNTFQVTAEDEDHAEDIVREMNVHNLLDESDFNVNYVDEAPSI